MSIFIPHNIESRVEKLRQDNIRIRQANLKMLQSEVIDKKLYIDDNFNFKEDQVKVRTIKGNVVLVFNLQYIPEWLNNVRIEGDFNIACCELDSLQNCPQYIQGNFHCRFNKIKDYTKGPIYVGGNYYCDKLNNDLKQHIIDTTEIGGKLKLKIK